MLALIQQSGVMGYRANIRWINGEVDQGIKTPPTELLSTKTSSFTTKDEIHTGISPGSWINGNWIFLFHDDSSPVVRWTAP